MPIPLRVSIAAVALTCFGWFWFAVCFTATSAEWWNSKPVFVGLFGGAAALALAGLLGHRKLWSFIAAVAACVWPALSLLVVLAMML